MQKQTPNCRMLVITLANDRTQNLEQPKKIFNLTQNFHTTRIDELHLFLLFARQPEQLETNGFQHQTRQYCTTSPPNLVPLGCPYEKWDR